jgi:hypothetical protein
MFLGLEASHEPDLRSRGKLMFSEYSRRIFSCIGGCPNGELDRRESEGGGAHLYQQLY